MDVCSVGFESPHIMTPYSDKSFTSAHACGGCRGLLKKFLIATEAWTDREVASGVPPGPPVLEASGGAVLLKKNWRWAGEYWVGGVSLVGSC